MPEKIRNKDCMWRILTDESSQNKNILIEFILYATKPEPASFSIPSPWARAWSLGGEVAETAIDVRMLSQNLRDQFENTLKASKEKEKEQRCPSLSQSRLQL
ncbi:hypothetical protein NL676_021015 [Syzygium grande]|nr:hypothetical protein NL676_021015 [Syzygium grande]